MYVCKQIQLILCVQKVHKCTPTPLHVYYTSPVSFLHACLGTAMSLDDLIQMTVKL